MSEEYKFSEHKNFIAVINGENLKLKNSLSAILIEKNIKDIVELEKYIQYKFSEYEKIMMENKTQDKHLSTFLINNYIKDDNELNETYLKTFLFLLKKMDSQQKKIYGIYDIIEDIQKYISYKYNFNPFD